ncbi:hypothetical protein EXE48_11910 [Halorubrum sp. ASP1]|uniref:hypothetical protein n=1 Tax=Halorubrum sp. ASP1 TaxID=2518114 RepID=UPI0010F5F087|nr:hypothetical protein [Halorubrum sp. ASP1]TKX60671.1 hypothetical protein EXE48_11910 [Halorubrum sp. ASP1]
MTTPDFIPLNTSDGPTLWARTSETNSTTTEPTLTVVEGPDPTDPVDTFHISTDEAHRLAALAPSDTDSKLEEVTRDLMAIERDRLLGYRTSDLHMDPKAALNRAIAVLEAHGYDPDELILPEDQRSLDLDLD